MQQESRATDCCKCCVNVRMCCYDAGGIDVNVGREDGKCARLWDENKSATCEMASKECGGKMLGLTADCQK
ncbi:hypothetical protein K443DRAFT_215867 [Laccaria amethystina LaAM-08-1]|uniref:Uncharacterized protein n=1 Tax=Laccaria amethystina LaAM-08-1 TaxID=1095629 RepID=A0A0C9YA30_9AGAR|nr:hypothetical protein K443DRAFT_215867 [Laccaria amethystina LaAM-08-1]